MTQGNALSPFFLPASEYVLSFSVTAYQYTYISLMNVTLCYSVKCVMYVVLYVLQYRPMSLGYTYVLRAGIMSFSATYVVLPMLDVISGMLYIPHWPNSRHAIWRLQL